MTVESVKKPVVAVLAMQGDFEKHIEILNKIGVTAINARTVKDIENADAIIIPGGESTTIGKLMARYGIDAAIKSAAENGKPIYGTCAGLIVLSKNITDTSIEHGGQNTLGLLDITVNRNAFGRQVDSFETQLNIPAIGSDPVPAVFIRAPIVVSTDENVETLSIHDGKIVFVRQNNILGSSFHPELTSDDRIHRYFLSLIK